MDPINYDQFINNHSGKAVDYDHAAGVQCVDLAKCYLNEVFGISPAAWGDAHCYYDNFDNLPLLKANFMRIEYKSGFVPQKGDIAVWKVSLNSGGCGHIAICTGEGNSDFFYSYDQNWAGKPCTRIKHNYEHFYGVLRPKDQSRIVTVSEKSKSEKNKIVADISTFQPDINYAELAGHFDGVIIRIGYRGYSSAGTLVKDNMFDKHIAGIVKNGIPFGFYFFSQAINASEAKEEADFAYQIIKSYKPTYPVYIDIEYSSESNQKGRADKLTERTDIALAFCRQMETHGIKSGVYASESWFGTQLDTNKLKGYSIWVAKYGTDNGTAQTKPKINPYDGWQFTSKYRTSAFSKGIDCSYFYNDFTDKINVDVNNDGNPSDTTPAEKPAEQTSITYTVKHGDTLTAIAKQYGTTVEKLIKANSIRDANLICIGQKIKIIK